MAAVDVLHVAATVAVTSVRSPVDVDDSHCCGGFEGDEWEQSAQCENKEANNAEDATTSAKPAKVSKQCDATALAAPLSAVPLCTADTHFRARVYFIFHVVGLPFILTRLCHQAALELPLTELYMSPAEWQAMPLAAAALLSGTAATAAAAPPFPQRISSERIRGIAFQCGLLRKS